MMNKLLLAVITAILMSNMMGCSSKSTTENPVEPESQPAVTHDNLTASSANLRTYDETSQGIPMKTKYPEEIEVLAMGSGEGIGVFFNFKPQGNAFDQAEVHFFFPTGATTANEIKTNFIDPLITSNDWTVVEGAMAPQELNYPWVKKTINFTSEQEMMGHILLGEINNQALQVTLFYPAEMSETYWTTAKTILDNVEFDVNLLPITISEGRLNSERSAYGEIPLPSDKNLVGDDPEKIAIAVFGISEPVEGNFQQQVSLESQSDSEAVVILTQTGLADDSVEGQLYRLEFVPEGNQWRLNWAGSQNRCYSGRGSQTWTSENCL